MSKSGHFLKTDEGECKEKSPHQSQKTVSKSRFLCQLPPWGKLGGYAAGSSTTHREMAICWGIEKASLGGWLSVFYGPVGLIVPHLFASNRCAFR
ncbi:MAG: hypothetical protein IJB91_02115 [Oscillospiraceae bacterium]|nr:hypothetical protein [Oscillospiraceae bacterium]